MIAYCAVLDVPWEMLYWLAGLLAAERSSRGTRRRTRALSTHAQAKLVLRRLRDRPGLMDLARDFHISLATAHRYCAEGIAVLAAHAPDLDDLLDRARAEDWAFVVVDGMLVPGPRIASPADKHAARATLARARGQEPPPSGRHLILAGDRAADPDATNPDKPISATKRALLANHDRACWFNDPNYSGKHHDHGMNHQVACGPSGRIDYIGPAMPGRIYDSKAAEHAGLPGALAELGIPVLADKAYVSIPGWKTPIKKPKNGDLTGDQICHNLIFDGLRFAIERGIAQLKGHWRILRHNPGRPAETGDIARACLVLQHRHTGRYRPPLRHTTY